MKLPRLCAAAAVTFQGDQSTTPTAPRWWAHNLRPRYNVCPTDPVDVVTAADGKRDLVTMRWGLIPRWWSKTIKEAKMATFNRRGRDYRDEAVLS